MTSSDLKYEHENRFPDSHYFTRSSMKFFGDTMRNYGVRSRGKYWELYRRRPVKHGLQKSAFFCKETYARVISPEL